MLYPLNTKSQIYEGSFLENVDKTKNMDPTPQHTFSKAVECGVKVKRD